MNLTPRAARQMQTLDPGQAAAILDQLRDRPHQGATAIIPVTVAGQGYRCFVGRHRDGCPVLLGVIAGRTANQASGEARPRDGPPGNAQRHAIEITNDREETNP